MSLTGDFVYFGAINFNVDRGDPGILLPFFNFSNCRQKKVAESKVINVLVKNMNF